MTSLHTLRKAIENKLPHTHSQFARHWLRDAWFMSIIAGLCLAVVIMAWKASQPLTHINAQTQKTLRITELTSKVTMLTVELQYWLLHANLYEHTSQKLLTLAPEIKRHQLLMQQLNAAVDVLNTELKGTEQVFIIQQLNQNLESFERLDTRVIQRLQIKINSKDSAYEPLVSEALQDLAQAIVNDAKSLHTLTLQQAQQALTQALNTSTALWQSIIGAMGITVLLVALLTWLLRRSLRSNATLAREINNAARTDPLTGLLNRRAFEQRLQGEFSLAKRLKHPLIFVLIDLDYFKRYNDTYGHVKGDELLKTCAHIWSSEIRASDVIARLGGEEFGIVFAACTPEQAVAKMTTLRHIMPWDTNFSAGVAQWVEGEAFVDWYRRADAALYAAKANGRARSEIAPMPTTTLESSEHVNPVSQ